MRDEFYCDCQKGIKGKLCWESMGLIYDRTKFPVDPRLNPLAFKRKRTVERPRNLGPALTKTPPPAVRVQSNYVLNGDEETEIQVVDWGQEQFVANTEEGNIQVETNICTSQSNCEEEEMLPAFSYCDTCKDYFCENCNVGHCKARRTRQHSVIVVAAAAPLTTAAVSPITIEAVSPISSTKASSIISAVVSPSISPAVSTITTAGVSPIATAAVSPITTAAVSPVPIIQAKKAKSKMAKCGVCEGCLAVNCMKCKMCLDLKSNGGTGKLKKACIMKGCKSLKERILKPNATSSGQKRKREQYNISPNKTRRMAQSSNSPNLKMSRQ